MTHSNFVLYKKLMSTLTSHSFFLCSCVIKQFCIQETPVIEFQTPQLQVLTFQIKQHSWMSTFIKVIGQGHMKVILNVNVKVLSQGLLDVYMNRIHYGTNNGILKNMPVTYWSYQTQNVWLTYRQTQRQQRSDFHACFVNGKKM